MKFHELKDFFFVKIRAIGGQNIFNAAWFRVGESATYHYALIGNRNTITGVSELGHETIVR